MRGVHYGGVEGSWMCFDCSPVPEELHFAKRVEILYIPCCGG